MRNPLHGNIHVTIPTVDVYREMPLVKILNEFDIKLEWNITMIIESFTHIKGQKNYLIFVLLIAPSWGGATRSGFSYEIKSIESIVLINAVTEKCKYNSLSYMNYVNSFENVRDETVKKTCKNTIR